MRNLHPAARGFTLVELLVAITIFALIGAISYRGVTASVEARDRLYAQNERWRALSRFFLQFEDDLWHSLGRPVRTASGATQAGFIGKAGWSGADDAQLLLARASFVSHGDAQGAARIGYRHAGDRLERLLWPVADAAPGQMPRVQAVLTGVSSVRFRYMNEYALWRPFWPYPQEVRDRPNALEISLTLDGGETVTRLFGLK